MNWRAALVILLVSSEVRGQEIPSPDPPVQTIPPGDDVITPLRRGEPAPYSGQLFNPETALRWANWLQQYKYRLTWDVERARTTCSVEMKYRDDLLKAEEERAEKVETDLHTRLERAEQARLDAEEEARNPPFYATVEFGVILGVLSAGAVFALAVWGVDSIASQ